MEKTCKSKNSKFAAFIKKNLYLILMIVCVIAIATMVAVTYALQGKGGGETADVAAKVDAPVQDPPKTDPTPTINEPSEPTVTVEEILFCMPAEGDVVGVFSNDTLVYNATLNQWSTHEAYDVAAEVGTEVRCVYDGTVKSVTTSVLHGTEVVIAHANGMQSIYSLLDSNVKVSVDQKVKKGDVIGKIAESGTFERHKGPHLHFELRNAQGDRIDPMEYFESFDN